MLFSHDLCDLLKLHVPNDPVLLDDRLVSDPLVPHIVWRANSLSLEKRVVQEGTRDYAGGKS